MEGLEGSPDLVGLWNLTKPTEFTFSKFDHLIWQNQLTVTLFFNLFQLNLCFFFSFRKILNSASFDIFLWSSRVQGENGSVFKRLASAWSSGSASQHSMQHMKWSNYHLVFIKLEIREKEHFNNLLQGATLLKTDFKNSATLFCWPFFEGLQLTKWEWASQLPILTSCSSIKIQYHAKTAAEHFICIKAQQILVFNKEIVGLWFVCSICNGD